MRIFFLIHLLLINSITNGLSIESKNSIIKIIKSSKKTDTNIEFDEWRSPSKEVYLIPKDSIDYGYHIHDAKLNIQSLNNSSTSISNENLSLIQEENIQALGFPNLWEKLFPGDCEEESKQEDYFPFGAKKFLMIGVKKESLDTYLNETNELSRQDDIAKKLLDSIDSKIDETKKRETKKVKTSNWFPFWGKEDDCEEEEQKNLFGTDKFFFVGIGSIDNNMTLAKLRNSTSILKQSSSSALNVLSLDSKQDLRRSSKSKTLTSVKLPVSTKTSLTTKTTSKTTKVLFSNDSSVSFFNETVYDLNNSTYFDQFNNNSNIFKNNGVRNYNDNNWSFLGALILIGISVMLF